MKTPSIEYQILLAASRIEPCQEQRQKLQGLITNHFDQDQLVEMAVREGVAGLLYKNLKKTGFSEDDLWRSIILLNRTRELMTHLNVLRKNNPPPLSGSEYLQIVLTGMSTPRIHFNAKLEKLLLELEGRHSGGTSLPRLMILGGGCDAPRFIDFIERDRARVVADGLCFGTRSYHGMIDEDKGNPLHAIARRYVNRVACPSTANSFDRSFTLLKNTITEWGIDGIVCTRLKFCDIWGGACKMIADALNEDGMDIPVLNLEREYNTMGSGQINTRVQAYLEMLS